MGSSTSTLSESDTAPQNPDEQIPKEEASDQSKNGGETDQAKVPNTEPANGEDGVKEEEEEEGECGFCLYMKGGGCGDSFNEWEKCMEEAEKNNEDVVDKCSQITSNLIICMRSHSDYYEPLLKTEKALNEESESDSEKTKKSEDQTAAASDSSARSN